jgi:hypothetical protein
MPYSAEQGGQFKENKKYMTFADKAFCPEEKLV